MMCCHAIICSLIARFLGMSEEIMKKYKTLITYGTFDLFHIGHVKLLQRMSEMAERVVVGLSTDDFNRLKGKDVVYPFEDRRQILLACRYVDAVFPEKCWEQKREDIIREKADVFVMGNDWEGKFDDLSDIVEVRYLSRTEGISTTQIKASLKRLLSEGKF